MTEGLDKSTLERHTGFAENIEMRTLAIGDIHGCNMALTTLLENVRATGDDQIVFLGDYIDRGPASREVIETLLHLHDSSSPIFLRGNHEVMILDSRGDRIQSHFWQSYGGEETLLSYGALDRKDWVTMIPASHMAFFESTARCFETQTHIFVHGGLDPNLDMDDQPDRLLYWERFEEIRPHKSGKKIICGHTRSDEIRDIGFAICIDTGPVQDGWLTCLEASSGKYWQANENGEARQGELQS
ncbi:MAG: serine/threonine protein phosphatase [Verrucomicrobiales bacterium]|nr:serine/threonine protein phosphatase [Verrucomicrobiales bacterium]